MTNILKLLAGSAVIAGLAAPAAAQYYPQPSYPQQAYPQQAYPYPQQGYPQQGYQQQGGIAGIINQLLGNRYNAPDRTAVTQCAAAAQAQAATQVRQGYGYNQGYQQGDGQQYRQAYAQPRVTGITSVQRRNNNRGLSVTGTMSSGMAHPYGQQGSDPRYGQQGYNSGYANVVSDMSFRCNVDYRGQVTNVKIRRVAAAYRR
jgi:hypothetical protein